jgi:hypothetical protein
MHPSFSPARSTTTAAAAEVVARGIAGALRYLRHLPVFSLDIHKVHFFICRLSGTSFFRHGNMRANQRDRARNGAHSKEQSHRAPHGWPQGTACQAQNGVVDTKSIVIIPVALFPRIFLFQLPPSLLPSTLTVSLATGLTS